MCYLLCESERTVLVTVQGFVSGQVQSPGLLALMQQQIWRPYNSM
jgi:hypothetical protein